jgi:hypothetical protein
MTPRTFAATRGLFAGLALSLTLAFPPAQFAAPQQTAPAAAGQQQGPRGRGAIDPRVQQRTYKFADTNEDLPYALFVSSKVSKDRKNPLIISLHGLGGSQNTMMTRNALQLAEEGGYIYVGPMGYSPSGWYGTPSIMAGGGFGARGGAPGGARGAGGAGARRGAGPGAAGPGAGPGATQPGGARGTTLGTPNNISHSRHDAQGIQCR